MYYRLKRGKLHCLIKIAAENIGTKKLLAKKLGVSKSNLYLYYNESRAIRKEILNKLINYTRSSFKEDEIKEILPDNWKQIKGGKERVIISKEQGTFESQLNKARNGSVKGLKKWHKEMKTNHTKEYYLMQWEKFKKVGEYKYTTMNKEKVRNELERDIANILKKLNIVYEYEPYINIDNKAFFPDFTINDKIILECTSWRGYDKAIKLKNKIKYLSKEYKVYVIIPKALNNYYKILSNHLVLGLDEFVPLAQTFRDAN